VANNISPYDHIWYANRAIQRLEKALKFTKTVFRAYDSEPRKQGQTIDIRKPGGFTAAAMPITTAADIDPSTVSVTLDQWYGVAFKIGDKEEAYTGERIVTESIDPAMQALAQKIEDDMLSMYKSVPWYFTGANPAVLNDLIQLRKTLNDNNVPQEGRVLQMTSEREADLLAITNFLNANEGSNPATQREGSLGRKFGFDLFDNQSMPTHTAGTLAGTAGILTNGISAVHATTINVDDATALSGTIKAGDILEIAGVAQKYACTADTTAAANAAAIPVHPQVQVAIPDGAAVTVVTNSKSQSLAYHPEAFALAMAPLSMRGNGKGAQIATVRDPRTNLALRTTMWYEPKDAESWVRFDALWGKVVLDPNRAVRWFGV